MPPKFTKKQMGAPLLKMENRPSLIADIEKHLQENAPNIVKAYPRGYFYDIVNESIEIARYFGIDDVIYIRLFVELRWSIAAGWFKEPQINAVLSDKSKSAEEKFQMLTDGRYDRFWDEAEKIDGPSEWRKQPDEVRS